MCGGSRVQATPRENPAHNAIANKRRGPNDGCGQRPAQRGRQRKLLRYAFPRHSLQAGERRFRDDRIEARLDS